MNFEFCTCLFWIILIVSFAFMIDGVVVIIVNLVASDAPDQPVVPVTIVDSNPCATNPCANGAYCKNDPHSSTPGAFFCICPRGYRGSHCNYTIERCKQLSCIRTDECWTLLDDVLCLCEGPPTPQLCLSDMGHSTMMERVNMVVSPGTWCTSKTWLIIVLVTLVVVVTLTIHCCKVSKIRRRLRSAADDAVLAGEKPDLPLPPQCEISRDLCRQFFCCRTDSKYLTVYNSNKSCNAKEPMSDDSADSTMDSIAPDQKNASSDDTGCLLDE